MKWRDHGVGKKGKSAFRNRLIVKAGNRDHSFPEVEKQKKKNYLDQSEMAKYYSTVGNQLVFAIFILT